MCFKGKTFKSRFLCFYFFFCPFFLSFSFPLLFSFFFLVGFFFLRSRELFVPLISEAQGMASLAVIICINCNPFEIKNDLL